MVATLGHCRGARACRDPGGARCMGAGLSLARGENHRAVSRRRHRGLDAAHLQRLAVEEVGAPGGDREPHRRRRQHRRRGGGQGHPDGYTLLAAPPPPLVINHNLYPKLGFDPTEFVPIVIMGRVPNALIVNAKVRLASVAELIAYAKANPGKLTCATQGNGTTSHLTAELFQMMAEVKFQQVPYRGSAPALTDLAAGNVDLMFDNLGASLALVNGGQLRLLAVATPKRMAALPQVPTIAETLGGFESAAWFAIVAPPKTPAAIVDKINADVNEALRERDIRERLAQLSAEPIGGTPQATAAYMREEVERWRKVIKAANVKLE